MKISLILYLTLSTIIHANFHLDTVFDNYQFNYPLGIENSGNGSTILYIVEQGGTIQAVNQNEDINEIYTFLDISERIDSDGYEMGLLGLAFHPNFDSNGYFFVNYTASNPRRTVISRFSVYDQDLLIADPDSEFIILEQEQPYNNHNGGQLSFGPDGNLYISFGDGGGSGDPLNNGQNLSNILGSIISIDINAVNENMNYTIPSTNPFYSIPGIRQEIYAYGLRNTWRFSFDEITGELWAGDVGQYSYEEINIIESGGNYGWKITEGFYCYNAEECDMENLIPPIWDYNHEINCSVTGGFVYRGNDIPFLYGKYIYADYCSGIIWSLEQINGEWINEQLFDTEIYISSFGKDEMGELYFCSLYDGFIYKFQSDISMIKGDVNLDFEINIVDIVFLVQYILSPTELDEHLLWICDYNDDSEVNIVDVVQIVDFILNGNN